MLVCRLTNRNRQFIQRTVTLKRRVVNSERKIGFKVTFKDVYGEF